VYVCMYANTVAHTHRHSEGPKNANGLNLGTHVLVYVYKEHMCIYMLGGGIRSGLTVLFL